jgi:translation initiation factor 1
MDRETSPGTIGKNGAVMLAKNSKLVYSTEENIKIEEPSDLLESSKTWSNVAYLERDRKRRKGKIVTVISGLSGDLKNLQKELQKTCGAGGSVKNNTIEIQGDHRDKIGSILQHKGYKIKFIGG